MVDKDPRKPVKRSERLCVVDEQGFEPRTWSAMTYRPNEQRRQMVVVDVDHPAGDEARDVVPRDAS